MLEKGWLKDHKVWVVWSFCLLKASYKVHKQFVGRQEVELQPGQFIFGRHEASEALKMKPSTLYDIMKSLERRGNIVIQSNNKFSMVTVVNWNIYQETMAEEQQRDQQRTNNKPTTNRHKQECKNEKKGDILSTASTPSCPHQEIINLFHQICPMLPQVRVWNDQRRAHLQARWREDPERQHLKWWKRFFTYIAESAFLTGQVSTPNRKPFVADLAWIIKSENLAKIIEGKYE